VGDGFKGIPVEQYFRFVEDRHDVYFFSIKWVEEDYFQGKCAVGKLIWCLEHFDRIAAS
jgi:hypothetical protein